MTYFLVENLHLTVGTDKDIYDDHMVKKDIENLFTDSGFYNVEAEVDREAPGKFSATVDCDNDDFKPEDWDGPVREAIIKSFDNIDIEINDDFTILPETDN